MGDGAQAANTQEGAIVFALDAKSGRPKWRTKVEADPAAMITSAPIVDGGVVFVGTASKAETQDRPTTFRGSVLALSADTGKILWQTYLTKQGYTGAGVWGTPPSITTPALFMWRRATIIPCRRVSARLPNAPTAPHRRRITMSIVSLPST